MRTFQNVEYLIHQAAKCEDLLINSHVKRDRMSKETYSDMSKET